MSLSLNAERSGEVWAKRQFIFDANIFYHVNLLRGVLKQNDGKEQKGASTVSLEGHLSQLCQ